MARPLGEAFLSGNAKDEDIIELLGLVRQGATGNWLTGEGGLRAQSIALGQAFNQNKDALTAPRGGILEPGTAAYDAVTKATSWEDLAADPEALASVLNDPRVKNMTLSSVKSAEAVIRQDRAAVSSFAEALVSVGFDRGKAAKSALDFFGEKTANAWTIGPAVDKFLEKFEPGPTGVPGEFAGLSPINEQAVYGNLRTALMPFVEDNPQLKGRVDALLFRSELAAVTETARQEIGATWTTHTSDISELRRRSKETGDRIKEDLREGTDYDEAPSNIRDYIRDDVGRAVFGLSRKTFKHEAESQAKAAIKRVNQRGPEAVKTTLGKSANMVDQAILNVYGQPQIVQRIHAEASEYLQTTVMALSVAYDDSFFQSTVYKTKHEFLHNEGGFLDHLKNSETLPKVFARKQIQDVTGTEYVLAPEVIEIVSGWADKFWDESKTSGSEQDVDQVQGMVDLAERLVLTADVFALPSQQVTPEVAILKGMGKNAVALISDNLSQYMGSSGHPQIILKAFLNAPRGNQWLQAGQSKPDAVSGATLGYDPD